MQHLETMLGFCVMLILKRQQFTNVIYIYNVTECFVLFYWQSSRRASGIPGLNPTEEK